MADAGLRPDEEPDDKGRGGNGDDEWDEPARYAIGNRLDRRTAALSLCDHADDARQHCVRADSLRLHDQTAGAVDGAAGEQARGFLGNWQRLACQHRFIDGRFAFGHHAIDRNCLAGLDPETVSFDDIGEWYVGFTAIGGDPARGLRRKIEQRPDGLARRCPCPQFENLTEQNQCHHDTCRFIIDRYHSSHHTEARRKQTRRDSRYQTIEKGCADPDRDQREHVEMSGLE